MAKGTVKSLNSQKGYAIIKMENGKEIFVHHNAMPRNGFKALNEGDLVEFVIQQGSKGEQAGNVVKL